MPRHILLGLLAGITLLSGAARGAERVQLDYRCDALANDCPTAQELADAVAVRLGYSPFDVTAGAQRIQVRVDHTAGVWTAVVQLWDIGGQLLGERRLTDPGGGRQGFAESIALAISLALDPLGSEPPRPVKSSDDAPANVPPSGEPVAPKKSSVGLVAALGLVGAVGAAPNPNLGLRLQVDFRWAHVSLGLSGRGDFPASGSYGGGTVRTSLAVGELVPCFRWDRYAGCLLVVAGVQSASGGTYLNASAGSAPFGAAGVRVGAEFLLGRPLSLEAALEAWSPVTRTSVDVGVGNAAWTTSPIEGAITLSILYAVL